MNRFVLDASVTLAWCLDEMQSVRARPVLEAFATHTAIVPHVWPLEVVNVLAVNERRRRIDGARSDGFLTMLSGLPIEVDHDGELHPLTEMLALVRAHTLSAYDAAYLELAARHGLPLATHDSALRAAAGRVGVGLFEPA